MTTKKYKPWAPDQSVLLPPSPREWLPPDHLAFFLLDVVDKLDLTAIEGVLQAKDPRGERPYAPRMMVALLLYSYCTGTFSSRKIERYTHEVVGTRVVAGGAHPDHSTLARFRRDHLAAIAGLFVQVVELAKEVGLAKVGRVALDGTRIKANASKHKAMSYGRMVVKKEALKAEIAALLAQAEREDQAEDSELGEAGYRDLPKELERRAQRLSAIELALAALERRAREARSKALDEQAQAHEEKASDPSRTETERKRSTTLATRRREEAEGMRAQGDDSDEDEPPPPTSGCSSSPSELPLEAVGASTEPDSLDDMDDSRSLPKRTVRHCADGSPHGRSQFNFTDPDSQLLKHQGGFMQGYNCQVVSNEQQLILSQCATNVAPDTHHLQPLMEDLHHNVGEYPDEVLADAGYWAPENGAYCESHGIDAYIATGREAHAEVEAGAEEETTESSGSDPPDSPRDVMRKKVQSEHGQRHYKDRKWIVEPVFGQIKGPMNFREFMLRGIEGIRGEWALACTAHNLLKLWRHAPATA